MQKCTAEGDEQCREQELFRVSVSEKKSRMNLKISVEGLMRNDEYIFNMPH